MQVLENAVRKLKLPSHMETSTTRVEPRFDPKPEPMTAGDSGLSEPAADPIPLVASRAVPTPPPTPRGPLFRDLPDPQFEDGAPMSTDTGGSGGGGSGEKDEEGRRKFGPILTGVGAVASIALLAGISIWTYKLGVRDARDVPVVAALEGPARVSPDDKGGMTVAHQGHSVNKVLEGQGVEAVASSVSIAPQDGVLTSEDAPQAELKALAATQLPTARPKPAIAARETAADAIARLDANKEPLLPGGTLVPQTAIIPRAPQTDIATVTDPAPEGTATEIATPNDEVAALKPEIEAIAPALDVSETASTQATTLVEAPRPLEVAALGPLPPIGEGSIYAPALMRLPDARPADLNVAMADAVNAALETVLAEGTTSPEIVTPTPAVAPVSQDTQVADNLDVIPLPAGTRMIQIGAYGSEAVARQQWDRLSGQHSDLLGAKDHFVQRTNSSGKVFYRLRVAGYDSKTATQDACAALSARGLPCITVTLR